MWRGIVPLLDEPAQRIRPKIGLRIGCEHPQAWGTGGSAGASCRAAQAGLRCGVGDGHGHTGPGSSTTRACRLPVALRVAVPPRPRCRRALRRDRSGGCWMRCPIGCASPTSAPARWSVANTPARWCSRFIDRSGRGVRRQPDADLRQAARRRRRSSSRSMGRSSGAGAVSGAANSSAQPRRRGPTARRRACAWHGPPRGPPRSGRGPKHAAHPGRNATGAVLLDDDDVGAVLVKQRTERRPGRAGDDDRHPRTCRVLLGRGGVVAWQAGDALRLYPGERAGSKACRSRAQRVWGPGASQRHGRWRPPCPALRRRTRCSALGSPTTVPPRS